MPSKTDPSQKSRPPLSKERVLRAALVFVDEHGIESLSMRRLACELGFEVMSLYNHVANKNDVLDGIVDLVVSEIDPPSSGPDWKIAMRQSAISAHQALSRHPWASSLLSSGVLGPVRLQYMESLLRGLREAGFSSDLTYHGFHALNTYILGFTLQEPNFRFSDEEFEGLAAKFLQTIPVDEFPHLTEHVTQHINNTCDHVDFEFGLDLILDGLERHRDQT